jgi:hypothetical protein
MERILAKFSERENQLLVINICQGESWDKLCSFLEKPIPEAVFPSIS